MNTETLLQEITRKAQKAKARIERLENENKDLRNSVFNYLQEIEQHKLAIRDLDNEMKNNALANSINSNKRELQKEMDKYILLIDKCIASLQVKID